MQGLPLFTSACCFHTCHDEKIASNHQAVAQCYDLPLDKVRWLVATIAFHCIAVADTVYTIAGKEPITATDRAIEEAEMEAEFSQSMYALIIGALVLVKMRISKLIIGFKE